MAKKEIIKEFGLSTLKGTIGAVPFAGTFLNEVLFEARSRLKQERINSFVEDFCNYVSINIKEDLQTDNLNPEKVGDILEEILISVSKTSANHKKEIFKKILLNQLTSDEVDFDETLYFINITNELSILQFQILSMFNKISDNLIKYKIHVLELEYELKQLESQKSELNKNKKDDSKLLLIILDREKKVNKLLKKKRTALQKGNLNPNFHKTFKVKREIFIVEIQGLIAKGLLFDLAQQTKMIEHNMLFGISKLGRRYMNYIDIK